MVVVPSSIYQTGYVTPKHLKSVFFFYMLVLMSNQTAVFFKTKKKNLLSLSAAQFFCLLGFY